MDVTVLRYNDKFCGVYLENGILLDARAGVGLTLKESGLQPKTVFLTSMSGAAVSGLAELDGVPIGNIGVDADCSIMQFPVGSKGDRKYGYRIKTQDGELVYAPEFDRLEKNKITGVELAILDPGDRSEAGDPGGLSHKSHLARERMAANAGIETVVWTDDPAARSLSINKKTSADLSESEKTALKNKARESGEDYDKLARMYIHGLESYDGLDKKPEGVAKQQYAMGIVNNYLSKHKEDSDKELEGLGLPKDTKEKSVDLVQQITEVQKAFNDYEFKIPVANDRMYASATFDDYIVVCDPGGSYYDYDKRRYFKVAYGKSGDSYTFAEPAEWEEVKIELSYTAAKSRMVVEKEQDGKYKWVAISSSDFRDADGEVVSTQAMDFAIAVAKKRGQAGNLVWDHYDELALGPCLSQARVGRFLVETGSFVDTPVAQKAAKKMEAAAPGQYRVSLGFKYWKGTLSEDGTYALIDIFHRAVTDHPSNAVTGIEVTKSMKKLTPEALKIVQKDLDLTDEEMQGLMAQVSEKSKETEPPNPDVSEVHKTTEAPVEDKPKTDDKPTLEQRLETALKSLEDARKDLAEAKTKVATEVKDQLLAALKDAPKGEVIRPSTAAPELTDEEKARLAAKEAQANKSGKIEGFEAYYHLFDSQVKAA